MTDEDPNLKQSPFLRILPGEIRNKIYGFCFSTHSVLYPDVTSIWTRVRNKTYDLTDDDNSPVPRHEIVLGLARTCRHIRDEVCQIYFGTNMFCFHDAVDLSRFLFSIGFNNRATVTKLEFSWGCSDPARPNYTHPGQKYYQQQDMLMLSECISLQKLHLGISKLRMPGLYESKKTSILNGDTVGLSTLRQIRGLVDLELKVRQISPSLSGPFASRAFEEVQPAETKINIGPLFTDSQVESFEKALMGELRKGQRQSGAKVYQPSCVSKRQAREKMQREPAKKAKIEGGGLGTKVKRNSSHKNTE